LLHIDIYIPNFAPLKINTMQKEGTVKFFNETKGFGFITPSNGGQDVFIHSTGLIDEIRENDKVEFEVENGRKGLNAVNVKVI
jgi:CspA family cold shock protein